MTSPRKSPGLEEIRPKHFEVGGQLDAIPVSGSSTEVNSYRAWGHTELKNDAKQERLQITSANVP